MGPLTMSHILLIALKTPRNYITDACASARHAVCCVQRTGTHMRVRGGATYTHRHKDEQDTDAPPAPPPFLFQHQPSCSRSPTQGVKSLVWPMFSGEVSEACFIFLWGSTA